MKILVAGKITPPKPVLPWWVGRIIHCPVCGGSFRLEDGDRVTSMAGTDKVERHGEVVCPTPGCKHICWFSPDRIDHES